MLLGLLQTIYYLFFGTGQTVATIDDRDDRTLTIGVLDDVRVCMATRTAALIFEHAG